MNARISLVTLGVTDLERATRFYRDGFGLVLRPESVAGDVAFFDMGGTWLALWGWDKLAADMGVSDEGSGFRGVALARNVHDKEHVDLLIDAAAAAGGTVLKPAADTFYGGYAGYFADPDGHTWEIAWNPHIPELSA